MSGPLASARHTDDSFLEFATNFLTFFSTRTEIKALAARDPVSAGLAVTGPTLTVIMAWLCSHGSGSGSHRMKAAGELFSGN